DGPRSLGDVLTGTVEPRDPLQEADGFLVLPSKPGPKTPQGLLLKPGGISRVLADLRSSADLVVIDAPPVETADTIAMAPFTDGVVFVAMAGKTPPRAVEEARGRLGLVGIAVVGGVLTDADSTQDRSRH